MPDGKPNILVIWGDDIGISNLSCYSDGLMGYRTPNIDRIANEGMRFTDSYGEQSCTAGRAAFISGQSVYRTGMSKVGVPGADIGWAAEDPTIAELLKPLGYATGQFGKNHFGDKNKHLPTVHGFDEFFGNLYHLNAEEEPEQYDYPHADQFPKLHDFALPRGVLKCRATDEVSAEPDDPKFGPVGKQVIEDTGPLDTKRMETIDDDITDATVDYIKRQHEAGNPVLRLDEHHPHAPLHPHQAGEPRSGRAVAVGLPRHDDRPRPQRRPGAGLPGRAGYRRRHDRRLLHRQRTSSQQLAGRGHHAVPQREGHQLGGRVPGPGDDPLAREDRGGQRSPTRSSSTTTGCRRSWLPPASPTSSKNSRRVTRPAPTATPSTRCTSTASTCCPT